VDGERSSLKAPHPFLTDPKVRQALALACDRKTINDTLYGRAGEPGINLLYDPPQYNSKSNTAEFSLDKANALLDAAGYVRGSDGYRAKNGVVLSVLYQTTVNSVRQKTQQLVKDTWEKLGVKTELKSIDAGTRRRTSTPTSRCTPPATPRRTRSRTWRTGTGRMPKRRRTAGR